MRYGLRESLLLGLLTSSVGAWKFTQGGAELGIAGDRKRPAVKPGSPSDGEIFEGFEDLAAGA